MHRIAAVALVLALAGFARAQAPKGAEDNWHHWRGPSADGSAPKATPPTKWDAKTNIAWKAELPGKGSATPIVWGDRVFVLTAVKTDRKAKADELPKPDPRAQTKTTPPDHFYKFLVLCFDRNSGKKLWEKVAAEAVPHEGIHETHSYAAGSPTTDGERLYASFGSYGTFCYDFEGKQVWARTDLGLVHSRLGWGEAVTPVVAGGKVLLNFDEEFDSKLYCLAADTGKTLWTAKRDEKTTWSTPLVVDRAGKMQVVTNGTTRVRGYDLATGEVVWQCAGMTVNPIPSPVRFGDSVIAMSGYRGAAALSIPLDSKGDLPATAPKWKHASGTPYVPSPALAGGKLFFTQANGEQLTVLDAKTGKVLLDKERLTGAKAFYASPVATYGHLYFVDRGGTTVVAKFDGELSVVSVNKLNDPIDASPVAVGKQLFLRSERFLYCIAEK
jgi:outer membrane protein assembly factor BamB